MIADAPTVAAHVAAALSVTRASAGEMLGRLEAAGLVARGPAKEVLLTAGRARAAERIVHRHRLVERFLVDVLQYSPPESFRLALEIRDAFPRSSPNASRADAPGGPCPHGWPVDPSRDREFAAGLVALSTLPAGAEATVAALIEHDADVLERLYERGLTPGTSLVVAAAGESIEIVVGGRRTRARSRRRRVGPRSAPRRLTGPAPAGSG